MIATNDFPGIYWGKSRSHRVVGVPERALLTALQELYRGRGSTARSICGIKPVEVKAKMHQKCGIFSFEFPLPDETP